MDVGKVVGKGLGYTLALPHAVANEYITVYQQEKVQRGAG